MNERIQELFEQAHKEFSEEHKFSTIILPNPLKEKFAELIVRECADVVSSWKTEPFPYDPEFGAKLIKEHFGVES